MDTGTLTVISGIVLLLVFALVGWRQRRERASGATSEGRDAGRRATTKDEEG